MLERTIALRVDVDTAHGLKKGVPRLLDLFQKLGVKVSFFVVMGPDSMGRHISRFGKKGYLRRILTINPFKMISRYGWESFFYGTLIKNPPLVAGSSPGVLRRMTAEGHEVGIHGHHHFEWAEHCGEFSQDKIRAEIDAAVSEFQRITGRLPVSSAAPNWRVSEAILLEEESYGFRYLTDVRGHSPFFPVTQTGVLSTLQIPQTMPTFHECLQAGGCARENAVEYLIEHELAPDRLNVFTMHDWLEGMSEIALAEKFIRLTLAKGYQFQTLEFCARALLQKRGDIPSSAIVSNPVPGGIGKVTCQEIKG